MNKNKGILRLFKSFKYAFKGILQCAKTEQNFRIHLISITTIFLITPYYNLDREQISIVILCCGFVLFAEILNTAIEMTMDKINKSYDVDIKHIKDISSAFVLVSALSAFLVGIMFYLDIGIIKKIITNAFLNGTNIIITLAYLTCSFVFIFLVGRRRS